MIVGRGWIKDPDKVVVKVSFEMTLEELKALRENLQGKDLPYWPFGKFAETLSDVARQVEAVAYTHSPSAPEVQS